MPTSPFPITIYRWRTTDSAPLPRIIDFRPIAGRPTLLAEVDVEITPGIVLRGCGILRWRDNLWCAPPRRSWIADDRVVRDEEHGHRVTDSLIDFATPQQRIAWSRRVLAALRRRFPDETRAWFLTGEPLLE